MQSAAIEPDQEILIMANGKGKNGEEKKTDRSMRSVTLSPKALEEFEEVATWKGMPIASYLRQILEIHHESPEFKELLDRARSESKD